ncbi:hypothetical protein [Massilia suwonensis]|uniref:hypothetical protein n=1 Tax=Massilia suwonensis TaxID=648895 RepID=UPI0036D3C3A1
MAQVERRQFLDLHFALDRQADRVVPGGGVALRRGQRSARAHGRGLAFGAREICAAQAAALERHLEMKLHI